MSVWDDEPVADAFIASGLYCLLRRGVSGAWMGYAGVTEAHALWRQMRDVRVTLPESFVSRVPDLHRIAPIDMRTLPAELVAGMTVPLSVAIDVHGGLFFTGMLPSVDEPYWYFGFSCAQPWDYQPDNPAARSAKDAMDLETFEATFRTPADYRTISYARDECEKLAAQLVLFARVAVEGAGPTAGAAPFPLAQRGDGLRV